MPNPAKVPVAVSKSPVGVSDSLSRSGLVYGALAYILWGVLPIYFISVAPTGAFELVALRIVFSVVFCVILLTATRTWPALVAICRQPRLVFLLAGAAALIYVNWQVYAWAVLNDHVIETALGYFINPIVTIFLGVFLLRERLRRAQWLAVAISGIAVVVLAANYGAFPWISLALAFSFGSYGLMKKKVGDRVDAASGLTIETAWLVPIAVIQLAVVGTTSGLTIGTISIWHTLLLLASGIITAVPLLLFAAAARRLPLVYMGLLQYLAPVLQFLFGAFILLEPMPPGRWMGFGLVWIALVILTVDMLASGRSQRRPALEPALEPTP